MFCSSLQRHGEDSVHQPCRRQPRVVRQPFGAKLSEDSGKPIHRGPIPLDHLQRVKNQEKGTAAKRGVLAKNLNKICIRISDIALLSQICAGRLNPL